jgi:thymidylate synthase (FAD)
MKVEYVNHMGDDLEVVDAARVSFAKTSKWEFDSTDQYYSLKYDDAKLIAYLAKHDHWTPFAHTAIKLRMQAPVPIRTQCFKHKQGFVENEESRRYISATPALFVPDNLRSAPTGGAKQGSSGVHPASDYWLADYIEYAHNCIDLYERMIGDGVCPEQARFVLPQGCEVQWIWTGNLYSYANFYLKRTDPHAQKEIQDLAKMVGEIIQPLFPVSWQALTKGD